MIERERETERERERVWTDPRVNIFRFVSMSQEVVLLCGRTGFDLPVLGGTKPVYADIRTIIWQCIKKSDIAQCGLPHCTMTTRKNRMCL